MSDTQNEVGAEQEIKSVPPTETQVAFYVLDADGNLVRDGECLESLVQLQAFGAGETVHRGHPKIKEAEPVLHTHVIPRQRMYPSVPEQLDVIWKILARNSDLLGEEGREMLARIQDVKDTIPKGVMYKENMSEESAFAEPFIQVNVEK